MKIIPFSFRFFYNIGVNIALFDAAPYWSGGAERVYFCARGFAESGHKVVIVCLPTSRLNELRRDKITIYNICPWFDLDPLALLKIIHILKKEEIDILDIHSPKFYWLGLIAAKILCRKAGITRNVAYPKKGIKRLINRWLYHHCDFVVAISRRVKETLIRDFALTEEKIHLIYDGGEYSEFSEEQREKIRRLIRQKLNISLETFLLTIIGRIERVKGHDLLLKSVAELKNSGYNVGLLIIGPVEEKRFFRKLEKLVKELNLSREVIFTGFESAVSDYLLASEALVAPSYLESMGKSILEAAANQVPFVTTTNTGVSEVLPRDLGIFVPAGDSEQLTAGLKDLIQNYSRYQEKAKKFNPVILDYKKMVREYLHLYNEVTGK